MFRAADPARRVDFQELGANPVFDELLEAIVAGDLVAKDDHLGADPTSPKTGTAESRSDRSRRPHLVALITIAAARVLLVAGLTLELGTGGPNPKNGLPNGAQITPWHAARLLPVILQPRRSGMVPRAYSDRGYLWVMHPATV